MDLRSVRRRCESTLRDLPVPRPFDVRQFADTVSARRGRPIHPLPKSAPVGPCGVWLSMPAADYVFFENATSPLHREHIILRELGHLLRNHAPTEVIETVRVPRDGPRTEACARSSNGFPKKSGRRRAVLPTSSSSVPTRRIRPTTARWMRRLPEE